MSERFRDRKISFGRVGRLTAILSIAAVGACSSPIPEKPYKVTREPNGNNLTLAIVNGVNLDDTRRVLNMAIYDVNRKCKITGTTPSIDGLSITITTPDRGCAEGFTAESAYQTRVRVVREDPGHVLTQISRDVVEVEGLVNAGSAEANANIGLSRIPDNCNISSYAPHPTVGTSRSKFYLVVTDTENCLGKPSI